ncbi:MAG TPA: hypothetical protein PK467_07295 [Candidatus Wallbacteria bacterium]|nr:hypothetical protein [Candidatus Wallbacteria bacterium]
MNSNPEVLFLHVPKFSNYYKPLDEFMNITYIPMGVFAMADLLTRERKSVQIVHMGIEWILDHDFSIVEFIRAKNNIKVVYMPLFWHYQSYDVINVASKIKAAFPDIYIILGGFTASYFADQIVSDFDCIDGVIKGYAEKPIIELTRVITGGGASEKSSGMPVIQNLMLSNKSRLKSMVVPGGDFGEGRYRSVPGGAYQDYVTDERTFNSMRFSALPLLKNFSYYIKLFSFPLAYSKNLSMADNIKYNNMGLKMFPIEIGRGCVTSCTWCAGCAPNQKKMNFVSGVMWRDPEKVADTIEEGLAFGYKTFAVCFDVDPLKQSYYLDLFETIRKRKIKCGLYFECYALPAPGFIESFASTFDLKNSVVAISPECGNEDVRRKNKGFYFSNADLLNSIGILEKHNITADIFFTMGIPSENVKTLYDTKDMILAIDSGFKNIGRMMSWGVQIEPGSPIFENPEKFGAVTDRKTFMDFYKIHSGKASDTYSALGYSIENYFLDGVLYSPEEFSEKIMKIKCADFCFLHNNCASYNLPFYGRMTCRARELKFKLKGFGAAKYKNMPRPEFK